MRYSDRELKKLCKSAYRGVIDFVGLNELAGADYCIVSALPNEDHKKQGKTLNYMGGKGEKIEVADRVLAQLKDALKINGIKLEYKLSEKKGSKSDN